MVLDRLGRDEQPLGDRRGEAVGQDLQYLRLAPVRPAGGCAWTCAPRGTRRTPLARSWRRSMPPQRRRRAARRWPVPRRPASAPCQAGGWPARTDSRAPASVGGAAPVARHLLQVRWSTSRGAAVSPRPATAIRAPRPVSRGRVPVRRVRRRGAPRRRSARFPRRARRHLHGCSRWGPGAAILAVAAASRAASSKAESQSASPRRTRRCRERPARGCG